MSYRSLPTRERGLKSAGTVWNEHGRIVAPYTGAWIEISNTIAPSGVITVAPYTGAWIEINALSSSTLTVGGRSLHGSVD